jgi:hypothetical protein
MDTSPEVLSWNPRGLNESAKRDAVRELVDSLSVNLVYFQETKMVVMDHFVVNQFLGPSFGGFDYLPALGTRGGILLAWNTAAVQISNVVKDSFAISGQVSSMNTKPWWITVVYGPQSTEEKI